MKRVLTFFRTSIAVAALAACAFTAAAQSYTIPPELWDRPRSADGILAQSAVRDAVRGYLQQPGRRLVIHHPAGPEPLLYAEELRSWLIALAVVGEDISLRPDRNRNEPLTLELMQ